MVLGGPEHAARPGATGWLRAHWLTLLVHVAAPLPLALLIGQALAGRLSADPVRDVTLRTGRTALNLLMLSLACTPVQILLGWRAVQSARRPLGLYAFAYALLHLLTFTWLDYGLHWAWIGQEIAQRPFVQVGLAAFLLLVPLAITSTRGWVRRLGKWWKRLQYLVYVAALLAAVHFFLAVKAVRRVPLLYGALLALMLIVRLPPVRKAIARARGRLMPPGRA
jgi:sulfoxide reductase heme-binding subunit YedZ